MLQMPRSSNPRDGACLAVVGEHAAAALAAHTTKRSFGMQTLPPTVTCSLHRWHSLPIVQHQGLTA